MKPPTYTLQFNHPIFVLVAKGVFHLTEKQVWLIDQPTRELLVRFWDRELTADEIQTLSDRMNDIRQQSQLS